jgi:Flp pilus assembly protein TadD
MELVEANADQVGDLQRALMLDTLGWAQFRAGKAELAIKTLLKSTQLQPVYANLSHLGRVYAAQGESARAYNTLVAARDEARRSNNPQEIEDAERYLQELNP